ncbi:MAG TPA: hypothetical protein V6D15_16275 [Oculatellaceae cyanobacterium]|jgi:hypothetical protein
MKKIVDLPCKDILASSISYFCRFREWLEGYDILIWYKDREKKCYYFQSYMGETLNKNLIPKVISKEIRSRIFDKFLKSLEHNGILEFQMDENPKIMNNYNDSYFVRMEDGRSHCFQLLNGYHGDPRFTKIQGIIRRIMM